MHYKKKHLLLFSALALLLVTGGVTGLLLTRDDTKALTAAETPEQSMFAFTGTDGWRQGPSNATSMALFSSANPDQTSNCFTSAEYYTGSVDVNAELQKNEQSLRSSGHTVSALGTKPLTIRTNGGDKEYELNQFSITTPDGTDKIMGGHAIGYLQLSDGYLKIYGNCNTAEQLPGVFPALEAYRLTKT